MARKNVHCIDGREQAGYDKLVELHKGDDSAAYEEWQNNGFVIPERAAALVSEELITNEFILEDNKEVDPIILRKVKATRKAKALLTSKLKSLNNLVDKHKGLEKGRDEIQTILDRIDEVDAEQTLIDFIGAADRMTKSAQNWMEKFESGEKTATLENIKRLEEYVASFSLLEELSNDMFEDGENKEVFDTVQSIMGRHHTIRVKYISLARKLISQQLQGNFHKITRIYEKKAEQIFNEYKKPHLEKSEIPQAKADFITNYLIAKSGEIDLRTSQYIENMLLQVVDVPILAAWAVNPKDMNHDIVNIAVEVLDKADLEIWHTMETVVDDSEKYNDEYVKYVGKTSNTKKLYGPLLAKDENGEVTTTLIHSRHPDYLEFEAKYKDIPAVWNMHTHLMNMVKEKDAMVYAGGRLNYELPFIEQGTLERIYNKGLISAIKEGVLDQVKLRGKDVELGVLSDDMLTNKNMQEKAEVEEVYITESGQERTSIPLHYRHANIDPGDQSFDVMQAMVLDYHNSIRWKTKVETAVFLDVLKDVVHESDIIQTTAFSNKLKVNKETQHLHTEKKRSNLEDTLEALIRHRIYGITIEGDPNATKILKTLGRYTSFITMGANVLSGSANYVHGTTLSWIEALAGSKGYFTPKGRAKAMVTYNKNVPQMLNDIGERRPKNKVNLLMRKFDAMSEGHLLNGKSYAQNNKIKRIADVSVILSANSIGEHAMQSVVMLAALDNIKVKNIDGKFLDKDFKPTADRNQAIGVGEAMLQEGTTLEFHPDVHSTEKTKGANQDALIQISRHIRRINRDLYGNYDTQNKARYQRTGAGSLISQMRGWLIPGLQKRWRGLGTKGILSKKDFIGIGEEYNMKNINRLSYNSEIQEFEEGHYVTAIRFLRSATSEVKAMRSMVGTKETWQKLDDQQKANVRKTMLEFAVIIGALLLSSAFEDDPDDPDDMHNIYAAYISRRLYSEMFTFTNPEETLRTFRSPAIALSTLENAINVVENLFGGPLEQYDTGKNVGEYKLWRNIKKLIPVVKQMDRDVEDAMLFLKK